MSLHRCHRILLTLPLLFAGCTRNFYQHRPQSLAANDARVPVQRAAPRDLPMYEGHSGRVATWADLMEGVAWADVIVIGEYHDDAEAHVVQEAVVEATLANWPGSAVSLEMLERNEQAAVDAWIRGELDTEKFVVATNSANWAGKGSWADFYQPILDSARRNGGAVIAANAPRKYVRMARLEGNPAMWALPTEEREQFTTGERLLGTPYYDRFAREMRSHRGSSLSNTDVEAVFRAQSMWDATMARSVDEAIEAGAPKVVHLCGAFHSDFDGGTVREIRNRRPLSRILVISCVRSESPFFAEEDRNRADLVILTAPKPPEEDDEEEAEEKEEEKAEEVQNEEEEQQQEIEQETDAAAESS